MTDLYRYCVYCGADCELFEEGGHADDCPTVTGVYHVRPEDLGELVDCPCCKAQFRHPGLACMDCGVAFQEGDTFAHRETDQGGVFDLVCVGCRVLNPETVDAD